MSRAAQEKARKNLARTAIKKLIRGEANESYSRRDLFTDPHPEAQRSSWQTAFLSRLEAEGLVVKVGSKFSSRYKMAPGASLTALLTDDTELTRFLWPQTVATLPVVMADEEAATDLALTAAPEDPAPTSGLDSALQQKIMSDTLKLVAATIEHVAEMRQQLKRIDEMVTKLYTDLTTPTSSKSE